MAWESAIEAKGDGSFRDSMVIHIQPDRRHWCTMPDGKWISYQGAPKAWCELPSMFWNLAQNNARVMDVVGRFDPSCLTPGHHDPGGNRSVIQYLRAFPKKADDTSIWAARGVVLLQVVLSLRGDCSLHPELALAQDLISTAVHNDPALIYRLPIDLLTKEHYEIAALSAERKLRASPNVFEQDTEALEPA